MAVIKKKVKGKIKVKKGKAPLNVYSFTVQATKRYGSHIIEERALPDFRDGLLPVQRRLMQTLVDLGQVNSGPYTKSAKVVGLCMGNYHPHGDSSQYNSMVGLTKGGKVTPLIEGNGNFGESGDPAAAMRYCVAGDTPLFTSEGVLFPAQMYPHDVNKDAGMQIDISDRNLHTPSLNSKFAKITKWIYSGIQPCVKVYTEKGHPIVCTGNEPFLVATKSGFIWKDADKLVAGDSLCRTSQNISGRKTCYTVNEAFALGKALGNTDPVLAKVPNDMFECTLEIVSAFTLGFTSCGAYVSKNDRFLVMYSSASVINDIRILLLAYFGITCGEYDFQDGMESLAIPLIELEDIAGLDRSTGYKYSKVIKVEPAEAQPVYDLTVEGTHAFTADGYILHNTEVKLSKYGENFIAPKEYLNITPTVKNYDGTRNEYVVLPALVPNILVCGAQYIAMGVNCNIPMYSLKSVVDITIKALKGKKITPEDCLDLSFAYLFTNTGGVCVSSTKDLLAFYKTGIGTIKFSMVHEVKKDKIIFTDRYPLFKISSFVESVSKVKGIKTIKDLSKKGTFNIEITMSAGYDDATIDRIIKAANSNRAASKPFNVNITERGVNNVAFYRSSVPDIINRWVAYRLDLEVRYRDYHIDVCSAKIHKLNLMILACKNKDIIFKALNQKDSDTYLQKELKLTKEDVTYILDQAIRRLSKLSLSDLEGRVKEQKTLIKESESIKANPAPYISELLKNIKI